MISAEPKDLEVQVKTDMFVVVYVKIVDNKKKGLEIEGPFLGPETTTMKESHEACRKLVSASKDTILVRTYSMDENSYQSAIEHAKEHFDVIFDQMESAALLCDKPRRKRKK